MCHLSTEFCDNQQHNPAKKQTNKQTDKRDENITFLAEVT